MERPWVGMALLVAVPLLALILVRMLWSGSGLWFLTVGIILLGLAAVVFLARRPQEGDYGHATLAPEPNRLPLVLTGLGALFLAMLLLPNFADGGDGNSSSSILQQQPNGLSSEVSGAVQQPITQPTAAQIVQNPAAQPTAAAQDQTSQDPPASDAADAAVVTGETYIVADGDTLWDIADRFGVTVEEIVAANGLESPDDIAIGDELIIPESSGATDSTDE
jgi:LysM repeat protein